MGEKSGLVAQPTDPDFSPVPDLEQKRGHVNDLDLLNLDSSAKVFAKKRYKEAKKNMADIHSMI